MRSVSEIEAHILARRFEEATAVWQACVDGEVEDWKAWFRLGRLGLQLRQPRALMCLQNAAAHTDDAAPLVLLAQQHLMSGDKLNALATARAALTRKPRETIALAQLGTVFAHCDDGEAALPLFEQAVSQSPSHPTLLFNLATAQRAVGLLAEAETTVECVLKLKPGDAEAQYFRAGLRRQSAEFNHVAELTAATQCRRSVDAPADAPLFFALGKELEDLGQYEAAFHSFAEGNRLRRLLFQYDVARDVATMDALIAQHDEVAIAAGNVDGASLPTPIFIVGLPRSGTTLVERILSAHPEVSACGELDAFPRAAVYLASDSRLNKEQFVSRSLAIPPNALARAYFDQVGDRRGVTRYFTDKLPINGLYLGLIARSLPSSPIVLLRRSSMANGFAMFSTLFGDAYPFSYSLEELGTYLESWNKLTDHWIKVLGHRLLIIDYEDLVVAPESKTRELLEFCGLSWNSDCLNFYTSAGSVSTASAVQVRRPIYRDSLTKWRHYKRQLEPLRRRLAGAGKAPASNRLPD